MKKFTFILAAIILTILISSCNNESIDQHDMLFLDKYYTNYNNEEFDHNNIVLAFGALSDIHMGAENQDVKLSNALKTLNNRAKFGIDAFLFAGDLTNTSGSKKSDSEIIKFRKTVNKHLKKETAVIYCLGVNHDHLSDDIKDIEEQRSLFEKTLGKRFYTSDVSDSTLLQKGIRHCVVAGFNFISIDYDIDGYTEDKLKWIDETLENLTKGEPNKPVFVAVHIPPSGTLYTILSKYSQIICFSGHTHLPLNTDKSIKQENYTQLHCGGMYYYRQSTKENKKVSEMGNIYDFAQGYLVEVDKDNNVRVIRMDFNNKSDYSPEWIINSPKDDKSHLKYRDLIKNTTKPFFKDDTQISFDNSLEHTLVGNFDSAINGNNPVEYYSINFWNRVNGTIKHEVKYISSQYALYDINSMPESYEFIFFKDDGEYTVSITAHDCFNASNSIFYNSGLYCTIINTEGGDAGIYINDEKTNAAAFLPGETVRIKVSPPSGYRYEIIVDNVTIINGSFAMPNENVEINVRLTKG